jgi:hypothetical protein
MIHFELQSLVNQSLDVHLLKLPSTGLAKLAIVNYTVIKYVHERDMRFINENKMHIKGLSSRLS